MTVEEALKDEAPLSLLKEHPNRPEKQMRVRGIGAQWEAIRLAACTVMLTWIAYAATAEMVMMPLSMLHLPDAPIRALEPFRIANQYGLFAVMTRGRYEIEFQGSNDGEHWTPYPFRYKPQALNQRPGIYAPYQPRFDWNLWFASLRRLAAEQFCPTHGRAAADEQRRRTGPVSRESFRQCASKVCSCRVVAVLVHFAERKAADGELVAARIAGFIRARAGVAA